MSKCIEKNVITGAKLTWMQKNFFYSFKTRKMGTNLKNGQRIFDNCDFFLQTSKNIDFDDQKNQKLCNNFNSNFSKTHYYRRFSTTQMKLYTFFLTVSLKLGETKPKTKVSLKLVGKKRPFLA